MYKYKQNIANINENISSALNFWQEMLLLADADEWAYHLNYSDKDLLNALYIFNHVAQNIAIKKGYFKDGDDATEKMTKWKEATKDAFGFDTIELTKKVLGTDKQ